MIKPLLLISGMLIIGMVGCSIDNKPAYGVIKLQLNDQSTR